MKLKRFLLRYYPPGIVGKPRGKKTAPEKLDHTLARKNDSPTWCGVIVVVWCYCGGVVLLW